MLSVTIVNEQEVSAAEIMARRKELVANIQGYMSFAAETNTPAP